MKQPEKKLSAKDYEKIGRSMVEITEIGFSNPKRMLWYTFLKGIASGLGIFLAGTLVIGLALWFLGLFDQVPLIGDFIQRILDGLNTQ